MNFRFRSHEKLKDPQLINYIFENGTKYHYYPLLFLTAPLTVSIKLARDPLNNPSKFLNTPLKIAFSVPKKKFRKAVDRNRVKRMMREAYRQQKNRIPSMSKNAEHPPQGAVVIYIGKEIPEYTAIFKAMNRYIDQLATDT